MYVIMVDFRIAAGQMQAFLPLMQDNATQSLAIEQGCSRFDVCTDPTQPDRVVLYEVYDSEAAFQVHLASPHFLSFNSATAAMVSEKTVQALNLLA